MDHLFPRLISRVIRKVCKRRGISETSGEHGCHGKENLSQMHPVSGRFVPEPLTLFPIFSTIQDFVLMSSGV